MNQEIQVHGLPRRTENTESKTADDCGPNFEAQKLREKRFENKFEIHGSL